MPFNGKFSDVSNIATIKCYHIHSVKDTRPPEWWMKYVSSNFKRLLRLAARGNSKEIISTKENNLQKTIKTGDMVINNVLKQNLNLTFSQLASMAIDAPKEAMRRAVCFAPNLIRLARSRQDRNDRPKLKKRIQLLLKDSGTFLLFSHVLKSI